MSTRITYRAVGAAIMRGRRGLAKIIPARLRQDQAGAVAVEFAFVALPFFTLIFAIIQIAMLFLTDQLLETAVNDAARLIRTGQAKTAGWTVADFNAQVCSELYGMIDCSTNPALLQSYVTAYSSPTAITATAPKVNTDGSYATSPSYDSNANTGSYIVVAATYYQYPSLFAGLGLGLGDQTNGTRLIGAVAAFRNEPFP